jgi:alkaline phosphatase D
MMGAMQERWFTRQADRSAAVWNVIAQQISFSAIYNPQRPELVYMDGWSGYPAARQRLTSYMAGRREKDFVVLTGDIHSNYVMDVKPDLRDATGPTLATEFIGTSISSGGDGRDRLPQFMNYETDMPMMKYHSARRGYVTCDVSPNAFTSHYRELPFVTRPAAPVTTAASFVVRRGRPGAVKL